MSDLISRKALIEFISGAPYMIEHDNLRTIVINWIEQQPTAYDIDKVIEQLQRQVDQYHRRAKEAGLAGCAYESCHNYSKACSYECALEIVRGEQE